MSIINSMRYCLGPPDSFGPIWTALGFMPFGLFFDFMDGKVARWRGKSSLMGQELDSLADLVYEALPVMFSYQPIPRIFPPRGVENRAFARHERSAFIIHIRVPNPNGRLHPISSSTPCLRMLICQILLDRFPSVYLLPYARLRLAYEVSWILCSSRFSYYVV